MQLFAELNQKNHATIILVTHDPENISYCTRLIQIRDGKIMEDRELNQ
jgi:putative ABC transport system ATP-binding protein